MTAARAAAAAVLRLWSSEPSLRSLSATGAAPRILNPVSSGGGGYNVLMKRSLCSAGASADGAPAALITEIETVGLGPEVQKIHHELMETMNKQRIPQSALVSSLLQHCSSPVDIRLALEAIARLRTIRAVQGHQQANFTQKLSQLVVDACLRSKDPQNALKTIWTHNIYGFTPSVEAAHRILEYAREQRDSSLMQTTLKTMVSNTLSPTRTTADIALRICKDQGNEGLLFALAKEFHENSVKLRPALYDVCISTAANAGNVKHVLEIQQWRSELKLPPTTASTFALAKVHLLKGKPKDAAQLICTQVQESAERDMYLRVLVRAWPVEILSRRKRSVKEVDLRTTIEAMLDELRLLGCRVEMDAAQKFGMGKETIQRVVYS